MGNDDLIIIINEVVVVIGHKDYANREDGIKMAIDEWLKRLKEVKKKCDFSEEIDDEIKDIKVYSMDLKEYADKQVKKVLEEVKDKLTSDGGGIDCLYKYLGFKVSKTKDKIKN